MLPRQEPTLIIEENGTVYKVSGPRSPAAGTAGMRRSITFYAGLNNAPTTLDGKGEVKPEQSVSKTARPK